MQPSPDQLQKVKQFLAVLGRGSTFDDTFFEKLRSREMPDSVTFSQLLDELQPTVDLCRMLAEYPENELAQLPQSCLALVTANADVVLQTVKKIQDFKLSATDNDKRTFDQIRTDIQNNIASWFASLTGAVSFMQRKLPDRQSLAAEIEFAHESLSGAREEFQKLSVSTENVGAKAAQALRAASQAAEKEGLASYVRRFRHESEVHGRLERRWFAAAVCVAIGVLAVAVLAPFLGTPTNVDHVQFLAGKIVVLSTLSAALAWCMRMYRVERHNVVLNRHRQNALMTFRAFANAPDIDAQTRNAVLLQATQAIFAQQGSGFVSSSEPAPATNIVEVLRSVSKE